MQRALTLGLGLALSSVAAAQTTLQLDATSGGQSIVFVTPGASVDYTVTGLLGGDASQGIAMFAFDLSFDGGALAQASAPASGPLLEFISPRGINNPAGFGGTSVGGDLIQVGGAMNTIANTFAPAPSGSVATGVGLGAAETLATGSLTAPMAGGSYTLSIGNPFANALDSLNPAGHWDVKPAEAGAPGALTVVVLDCDSAVYCAGKPSSVGTTPTVTATGTASLSGTSTLTIRADNVVNRQIGLFVYGVAPDAQPLFNGTLCIAQPLTRMFEPLRSGGAGAPGTNDNGRWTRQIDAAFLNSAGFMVGDIVYAQWIFRDPPQTDGTGAGLTNAAAFVVCP